MVIHTGILTASYFNFGSSTEAVLLNPLKAKLNPVCHLLTLGAHHILHISRIRIKCSSYWFNHHNFACIWADQSTHAKE
jgi:hypothetical protein